MKKRLICTVLAGAMALSSLTGCGNAGETSRNSSNNEMEVKTSEAKHFFKAEFLTDASSKMKDMLIVNSVIGGNKLYYDCRNDRAHFRQVYVYDFAKEQTTEVNTIEGGGYDYTKPDRQLECMTADKDGNLYEVITESRILTETFDFDPAQITEGDAVTALAERYSIPQKQAVAELEEDPFYEGFNDENGNLRYDWLYVYCNNSDYAKESRTCIEKYDAEGTLVDSIEIHNSANDEWPECNYNKFILDKDGNFVFQMRKINDSNGSIIPSLTAYDTNGNIVFDNELEPSDMSSYLFLDGEGNIRRINYDDETFKYSADVVDINTGKAEKGVVISNDWVFQSMVTEC